MTSYIFSTNPLARLKALGLKVAGTKAELEARYQVPSGGWRGLIEIMDLWCLTDCWDGSFWFLGLIYIYFYTCTTAVRDRRSFMNGSTWYSCGSIFGDPVPERIFNVYFYSSKESGKRTRCNSNGSMCLKDWVHQIYHISRIYVWSFSRVLTCHSTFAGIILIHVSVLNE